MRLLHNGANFGIGTLGPLRVFGCADPYRLFEAPVLQAANLVL